MLPNVMGFWIKRKIGGVIETISENKAIWHRNLINLKRQICDNIGAQYQLKHVVIPTQGGILKRIA